MRLGSGDEIDTQPVYERDEDEQNKWRLQQSKQMYLYTLVIYKNKASLEGAS